MTDSLGIGLIGCGASRWMFALCFRFLREGRLVAVSDPDPEAVQAVKSMQPHAQCFDHYEDMLLKPWIDAVIVASPTQFHCEQVIAAAQAGKHILCEKPMACTLFECDRMIKACHRSGVTLMVALVKRFDQSMREAKRMIEAGELGSLF